MESCASVTLTNTGPVQLLSAEAQPWRVASPQDQPLLSQLGPGSLTPLAWLGEGAYGCVELCRVSVSIPITPRDDDSLYQLLQQQRSSNAAGNCSTFSHTTTEGCDDPAAVLRPHSAAEPSCPSSAAAVMTSTAAAGASEAIMSPREVVVRPGRFSVNRLHLSPSQPHDLPVLSPCTTPGGPSRPLGYLARWQRNRGHVPLRSSAPADTTATVLGLAGGGGASQAAAATGTSLAGDSVATSGVGPVSPSSVTEVSATAGACGASGIVCVNSVFPPRTCSSGSNAAASSAPPSARSPGRTPAASATTPSTPSGSGVTAAAMVRSNELVVAVKRVGFRAPPARPREPEGCVACTGGAVGRGRGGGGHGPSRTRLNRMHAIELLQLSRCRDCPFIVRVFGCVPDDPRPPAAAAGGGGAAPAASVASPRPSKQSPRLLPPPTSSSSSCRIVLEWAEGGDLGSLLKALAARRGSSSDPSRERLLMSESSARFYLGCLLEALSFLHGKGLLHRDVKPANLLLTSDGRAKLGDLGMVCHLDRDGMAAGRSGTPNYMAPEVWAYGTGPKFSSYGVNADLWSAGVVLHEMLTGHLPASHPDEYLRRNWAFSPRQSALSPELRDLLARLLTPKPRRRLQSCAEVVAHPWFAGFDWQGLRNGTLPAPYVPAAHRPLGGGGATAAAAAAAAARLRQSPGATASAGTGGGGLIELMPPLLEENSAPAGASAATAAGAHGGGEEAAAALAAAAVPRNPSTGAQVQSVSAAAVPAATGPTTSAEATGMWAAAGVGASGGQGALESLSDGPRSGTEPSRPASQSAAAPASAAGTPAAFVWRALTGWPAAPWPPHAAVSASAPVSASASAVASASALPRRGASHGAVCGSGSDCGAAAASGVGAGSSSSSTFGLLGTALASILSPAIASSRAAHAVPAATADASAGECSGREASRLASAAAATAAALGRASAATGSGGGARTALARGSGDSCVTPTPTTMNNNSCGTIALFLSTAASGTVDAAAGEFPPARGNSRATAGSGGSAGGSGAGSRGDCGSGGGAGGGGSVPWRPGSRDACGSLVASSESQAAAAVAASAAPTAAHARQGQPRFGTLSGAPLGYRRASASDAVESAQCSQEPAYRKGQELRDEGARPVAVPAPQSAVLVALASLQHHAQGLGPAGRRAGWWLQQRLADAAALAAALPDQLQSAAAAAAAAVGAVSGGDMRVTPGVVERPFKSEGGAADGDDAPGSDVAAPAGGDSDATLRCVGAGVQASAGANATADPNAVGLPGFGVVAGTAVARGPSPRGLLQSSSAFACDQRALAETCDLDASFVTTVEERTSPCSDEGAAAPPAASTTTAAPGDDDRTAVLGSAPDACAATPSERGSAPQGGAPSTGKIRSAAEDAPGDPPASSLSVSVLQLLRCPLSGQGCSATDLLGHGSDAATVHVVVRRSTGCGSGAAGVGAGNGRPSDNVIGGGLAASGDGGGDCNGVDKAKVAAFSPGGSAAGGGINAGGQGSVTPGSGTAGSYAGDLAIATATAAVSRDLQTHPPASLPTAASPQPSCTHKRTGSFCFDPLDQGCRPVGRHQPSGSPTTPLPPSRLPSISRSRCRSGHARSPSFSFDVGGLLSAGLLLSGSPVLMAAASSSSADDCGGLAAAAALAGCVAPCAAATSTELGSSSPPARTSALGSPEGGAAVRGVEAMRPAGAGWASASGRVPGSGGGATAAHWQLQPHSEAAEAAMLMYAACAAVLVMAWAVAREGGMLAAF